MAHTDLAVPESLAVPNSLVDCLSLLHLVSAHSTWILFAGLPIDRLVNFHFDDVRLVLGSMA